MGASSGAALAGEREREGSSGRDAPVSPQPRGSPAAPPPASPPPPNREDGTAAGPSSSWTDPPRPGQGQSPAPERDAPPQRRMLPPVSPRAVPVHVPPVRTIWGVWRPGYESNAVDLVLDRLVEDIVRHFAARFPPSISRSVFPPCFAVTASEGCFT